MHPGIQSCSQSHHGGRLCATTGKSSIEAKTGGRPLLYIPTSKCTFVILFAGICCNVASGLARRSAGASLRSVPALAGQPVWGPCKPEKSTISLRVSVDAGQYNVLLTILVKPLLSVLATLGGGLIVSRPPSENYEWQEINTLPNSLSHFHRSQIFSCATTSVHLSLTRQVLIQ